MRKTITNAKYLRLLDWLKKARIERGMTIRDLGERLKRPSSYVTKVEQAERRLDIYEYVVYCEALGVDPHAGIDLLVAR
jgi:transcriptional regulator with XRE-family HTH domain